MSTIWPRSPTEMASASLPIRCRLSQPKKRPVAPYPELRRLSDPFFRSEFDELVKHRSREPGFESVAHQNIGRRLAARSGFDAQRVVGRRRHKFVQIGAEYQVLVAAFPLDGQRYGEERDVFDPDASAFGRGDQPITAIRLSAQDGGEELDERRAADGRSAIEPGTAAGDPHIEIAAIDRQPSSDKSGDCRRGI